MPLIKTHLIFCQLKIDCRKLLLIWWICQNIPIWKQERWIAQRNCRTRRNNLEVIYWALLSNRKTDFFIWVSPCSTFCEACFTSSGSRVRDIQRRIVHSFCANYRSIKVSEINTGCFGIPISVFASLFVAIFVLSYLSLFSSWPILSKQRLILSTVFITWKVNALNVLSWPIQIDIWHYLRTFVIIFTCLECESKYDDW